MAIECGQAGELITRTISGNSSASEEAELKRHLLTCSRCRETEARLRKVWSLMGQLRQVTLPQEKAAAGIALAAQSARAWTRIRASRRRDS